MAARSHPEVCSFAGNSLASFGKTASGISKETEYRELRDPTDLTKEKVHNRVIPREQRIYETVELVVILDVYTTELTKCLWNASVTSADPLVVFQGRIVQLVERFEGLAELRAGER